jgi:hypothetical protein
MHLRLGCATPDTYKMSAEDRAACLKRLAESAPGAHPLGINIPSAKQADYDRYTACHAALGGPNVPSSTSASAGTAINGLGANPTLRQCGPGDR